MVNKAIDKNLFRLFLETAFNRSWKQMKIEKYTCSKETTFVRITIELGISIHSDQSQPSIYSR